jgi:DNA-binding response OmpR family regulator
MDHRGTALVVEPDARTRGRLRRALRRRGYEVIATGSRSEASDLLDGSAADILIVDEPKARGAYRVVWLADAAREDVTIEPTREGWRRFDGYLSSS